MLNNIHSKKSTFQKWTIYYCSPPQELQNFESESISVPQCLQNFVSFKPFLIALVVLVIASLEISALVFAM